jgi:hypothetical protein
VIWRIILRVFFGRYFAGALRVIHLPGKLADEIGLGSDINFEHESLYFQKPT